MKHRLKQLFSIRLTTFVLGFLGGCILVALIFLISYGHVATLIERKSITSRTNGQQAFTEESNTLVARSSELAQTDSESNNVRSEPFVQFLYNADQFDLSTLVQKAQEFIEREQQNLSSLIEAIGSVGFISDNTNREAIRMMVLDRAIEKHGFQVVFEQAIHQFGEETIDEVLVHVVNKWTASDPIDAINGVQLIKDETRREGVLEILISAWAQEKPESLYENLHLLQKGWLRQYGLLHASLGIARTNPSKAIELLSQFSNTALEEFLIVEISHQLSRIDPTNAMDWAKSFDFTSKRLKGRVFEIIVQTLAVDQPEYAFELAQSLNSELSYGTRGSDLVFVTMREIAAHDVENAKRLLNVLTVDDPSRQKASTAIGLELVKRHTYEEAVALGKELNQYHQESYFDSIFESWAHTNPHKLHETIQSLPQNLQLRAATHLLYADQKLPILTVEERNKLWSAFPEDSMERMRLSEMLRRYRNVVMELPLSSGMTQTYTAREILSAALRKSYLD